MSFFDKYGNISELIIAVGASVGIGFGIYNYNLEKTKRFERFTFEFSERYSTSEMQATRLSLRHRIDETIAALGEASASQENISLVFQKQLIGTKALNNSLTDELFKIADYFNNAKNCVESNLCSKSIFVMLHSDEVDNIICLFSGAMNEIGKQRKTTVIFDGLHEFKSSKKTCG